MHFHFTIFTLIFLTTLQYHRHVTTPTPYVVGEGQQKVTVGSTGTVGQNHCHARIQVQSVMSSTADVSLRHCQGK